MGLIETHNRSEYGSALVVYIHGWNNSASEKEEKEGQGSIYQFREMLLRLKADHRQRFPGVDIPVVGVYIAWRGKELIFPADLVILFNPAGSAIQTIQLVDILARNRLKTFRFDEEGRRIERPLLLSFTSATDKATENYFPMGMRAKGFSKKFRAYGTEFCSPISNQSHLYSHTAGRCISPWR